VKEYIETALKPFQDNVVRRRGSTRGDGAALGAAAAAAGEGMTCGAFGAGCGCGAGTGSSAGGPGFAASFADAPAHAAPWHRSAPGGAGIARACRWAFNWII